MAVGILFDFYRIVRWRMRLNSVLTFLTDILFSITALIVIFLFAQKANYLEMRFYIYGGSILGLFVYLRTFSSLFKNLFLRLTYIVMSLEQSIIKGFKTIYLSVKNALVFFMSFPYALLRWFALLIYRILELLTGEFIVKSRSALTQSYAQVRTKARTIKQLFKKNEK